MVLYVGLKQPKEDEFECFICKEMFIRFGFPQKYIYKRYDMKSHPQSGDGVCKHCADTIIFPNFEENPDGSWKKIV